MRRTLTACRTGLSVAAAVVLLSACGGSDEDSSASSTSEATSSASESSAEAAGSEFCTQAAVIQERVGATLTDQTDPTALPGVLQQAATEIRAVEPPEEIAADWNALADGVEQIAGAFGSIDFNDPNAVATFQQQIGQLQTELATASTNVETYLRDECGLESTGDEPAAPSS
jgi:hypothetical protein